MRTRLLLIVGLVLAMAGGARAQADHEGVQVLDDAMAQIGERARQKEDADRRFSETCGGTVDDVALALLPRCQGYLSDSRRLDAEIRSAMSVVEEKARRAGIYPGTVREMRHRYDLDEYARPVEQPHHFRQ